MFLVDEAIRIFYKLNWQTTGQKYLNKLFAVARKNNKVCVLCIPRFSDLTEFQRNHRVYIWIHCYARGKAVVFRRLKTAFAIGDVWQFRENWKVEQDAIRRGKPLVNVYRRTITFLGTVKWKALPEGLMNRYRNISTKAIGDMDSDEDKSGLLSDMWRDRFRKLVVHLLLTNTIKRSEVAAKANMPTTTLTDILGKDVRRRLKDNKHLTYVETLNESIKLYKSPKISSINTHK